MNQDYCFAIRDSDPVGDGEEKIIRIFKKTY